MKFCLFVAILFSFSVAHSEPEWAKKIDTQKLNGTKLTILCVGDGPSLELARQTATGSCLSTARRQLITKQNIKSLTVETESSVGFHEEVSENIIVSGLTCRPKKEAFEAAESSVRVWLLCEYDLEKATVREGTGKVEVDAPSKQSIDGIENRHDLKQLAVVTPATKVYETVVSSEQNVIISSVPSCQSIIVRGKRPRTHKCQTNPVTLLIYEDDDEAIVRAPGYLPKTIKLKSGGKIDGPIQIFLDRL